ncbi:TPA: ead/Ea22-like family protein [Escherichia coli]|nr:ead/Ea22-like family protein [Escherichia coli]HEA9918412.1 ead/Ea22-like family protein [Escherichia coli]
MSKINYQALREAAEQAMHDYWGFDADLFHELVTPSIVLALLDELERNQQYIKRRDQENEDIALTVGKLRVELEAAKKRIAELEAELVSQTYKLNELSGNSPVTPDGWISCSERMPEMGERQCYVLAADFKNNYPPNIPNTQVGVYGDWFNDGNPTWDDGDGEDLYLKEVTHWMPLPEPPKEVNRG